MSRSTRKTSHAPTLVTATWPIGAVRYHAFLSLQLYRGRDGADGAGGAEAARLRQLEQRRRGGALLQRRHARRAEGDRGVARGPRAARAIDRAAGAVGDDVDRLGEGAVGLELP